MGKETAPKNATRLPPSSSLLARLTAPPRKRQSPFFLKGKKQMFDDTDEDTEDTDTVNGQNLFVTIQDAMRDHVTAGPEMLEEFVNDIANYPAAQHVCDRLLTCLTSKTLSELLEDSTLLS
jgi:hypothetical protein